MVGLLGRKELGEGTGLWLEPCNGIHTFAMRFPIDVLFLDREGRALKMVSGVRPWRVCGPVRGARVVIELPAGTLQKQKFQLGKQYKATEKGGNSV